MTFLDLIKNTKKDVSTFPEFRLAILADSSTPYLIQALKGMAYSYRVRLEVFDPGIDLGTQELLSKEAALSSFKPSLTFLYSSIHGARDRFFSTELSKRPSFAETLLGEVKQTVALARSRQLTSFLLPTFPLLSDAVFGQLGSRLPSSFQFQIRRYNYLLTDWASQESGIGILDLETISAELGQSDYFDPTLYYSSKAEISFKGLPIVAERILQLIATQMGKLKKCVAFDLDNTIWGGIVGDDGLENLSLGNLGTGKVFSDIQKWLKELKNRGILLCVCSKNEEKTAWEVFDAHPDMVLRRDDIVFFAANWEPKSHNMATILQHLNIGSDSMVFLDDNPAERELIRSSFPDMVVPELPQDPALWLSYLISCHLFETTDFSATDLDRTHLYQVEQQRKAAFETQDLDSYLKGLDMKAKLHPADRFSLPRMAQLSQRTNQFNLRTQRYSEQQLARCIEEGYISFAVSLSDKFGEHGIVSLVLLQPEGEFLFLDSWLMSCRVFGRGLECLVFDQVVSYALKMGKQIKAAYIPTLKNKPVETLLPDLGFQFSNGFWFLDPKEAKTPSYFIALT
jgi:FkbH-like protein